VELFGRYVECVELYVRSSIRLNDVAVKNGESFIFHPYRNICRRTTRNSEHIMQHGLQGPDQDQSVPSGTA
jgi:hypothetical protein